LVELLCVPDRGGWAEDLAQDGEVVASQHEEHHVELGVARMVRTERFSDAGDHLGSPLLTAGGHRLGYVVDPDGQHILAPELFEVASVVVQVDAAWAALRLDPPGRPLEGRVVHLHVTHHDQYAGLISRFLDLPRLRGGEGEWLLDEDVFARGDRIEYDRGVVVGEDRNRVDVRISE